MKQLINWTHFKWVSLSVNVVLIGVLTLVYFHVKLNYSHLIHSVIFELQRSHTHEKLEWENSPIDFLNATAVFNAVQGAMKQRNADLFPNGVSFIPAYIPANTPLYHSTSSEQIPDGPEWIAFDYEFSYDFAHFPRGNRPRGPHPPPHPPFPPPTGEYSDEADVFASNKSKNFPWREGRNSYLLTFRSSKPLDKVIYLDGASAAKTNTGPMDQQLILSRQADPNARVNERDAAAKICKWGEKFGLQGVIRLEIGFEMILCDFHHAVTLTSNVTLNNVTDLLDFPRELSGELNGFPRERNAELNEKASQRSALIDTFEAMGGFEHLVAGEETNRGEKRVHLDFSRMVTALNKTWLNPDPYLRRMNNLSIDLKEGIIDDLEKWLEAPYSSWSTRTDWQLLTERIERKFGPMLMNINNTFSLFDPETQGALSVEQVAGNITQYLYNFVRRYSDDTIQEWDAKRENAFTESLKDYLYVTGELRTESELLIYSSINKIYTRIFHTLFDLFEVSRAILVDAYTEQYVSEIDHQKTLLEHKRSLANLLSDLRWAIFTRCSAVCGWDEVCYTPTWGPGPLGWGASEKWFESNGESFWIGKELRCISIKDILRN